MLLTRGLDKTYRVKIILLFYSTVLTLENKMHSFLLSQLTEQDTSIPTYFFDNPLRTETPIDRISIARHP